MWTRPIVRSKWSAQSGKRVWRAVFGALKIVAEGEAGVEVDNLSPRRHDLAHQTPAHLEGVGDNFLADLGDFGRFRAFIEDQPQLLLAVGQLAFRDRIEAQDSLKEPIGKPIEQPYRRLEDQIEEPQRPADPQSRRYGLADSDGFRREFAQDDVQDVMVVKARAKETVWIRTAE